MECPDAAHGLANDGRLGRVGKSLRIVTLGEGREALSKRTDSHRAGIFREIPGHAIGSGGQHAFPMHFKVFDGGAVAFAGVVPCRRLNVLVEF